MGRWSGWRRVLVFAVVVAACSLLRRSGAQLLTRQAQAARREIFARAIGDQAPKGNKVYGKGSPGRIELLVLGDSIAAGLGADRRRNTLGGRLAKTLAARTQRSVRLRTVAVVGARTHMVLDQIEALPEDYRPDLAVVVVGGNDVTHGISIMRSVSDLGDVIDRLHALGAEVIVGTCPNLGAIRPLPQPLRTLASRRGALLARAQRSVALARGARTVSLGRVVGPIFLAEPEKMFSLDRFHPSVAGYRRTAKAMLPSLLAAVGELDELPAGHSVPKRDRARARTAGQTARSARRARLRRRSRRRQGRRPARSWAPPA
ncbi:MAG: SGNH/GDSL hydrolase family protein [Propionibacteriaceae bacterium]|nr:SGNH/GDSL hydrolase family protein [Propionibacteriaceae bacterium]